MFKIPFTLLSKGEVKTARGYLFERGLAASKQDDPEAQNLIAVSDYIDWLEREALTNQAFPARSVPAMKTRKLRYGTAVVVAVTLAAMLGNLISSIIISTTSVQGQIILAIAGTTVLLIGVHWLFDYRKFKSKGDK
jgi:hypothetical protein